MSHSNPSTNPRPTDSQMDGQVKLEHIAFLQKIIKHTKEKQGDYLTLIEKLSYLLIEFLSNQPDATLETDATPDIIEFVDKINKSAVDAFNSGQLEKAQKDISRVVDLLRQKHVLSLYKNQQKLDEQKILTFNNLSCIYRKKNKLSLALKVVNYACELEEDLARQEYGLASISIISTYLNKCAILSEMKRHDESVNAVKSAQEYLKKALSQKLEEQDREYLGYLEMLTNYNMGAEYEHLKNIEKAVESFQAALNLAKEQDRQEFITKLEKTIKNIKK